MKRNPEFWQKDFIALLVFAILFVLFLTERGNAAPPRKEAPRALSQGIRTLRLTSEMIAPIHIMPGRSTVLSFPTKPTKVILGSQGIFAIEYVENDIAIAALSPHSASDLFVYLEGRRFAFNLITVPAGGDSIVLVRDSLAEEGGK